MKIERISENKIKCTLNREDLDSHNIVLTEFAYGSEKARAFFHDLMLQAEDEVGFEAEDIPLMIEAIPVNQDCIVLFVTKVSDPEELDTRFSRFSSSDEEDADSDEEYDDEEDDESAETDVVTNSSELLGAVRDAVQSAVEGLSKAVEDSTAGEFIPLPETAPKISTGKEKKASVTKETNLTSIYRFARLDDVCSVAQYLQGTYHGDNTLYKDMTEGSYYLVVSRGDHKPDVYTRICNVLSEYAVKQRNSYALQAYYEEHYICVVRSNALQTLAAM